jgi:HEAT repeat protein
MRMRSWLVPLLIAAPLFVAGTDAVSCIRFKKPGGSVPPGMREPKDPPPPPTNSEPTPPPTTTGPTPVTPTTPKPNPMPPTTGSKPGPVTGEGPEKKKQAADDTTWETWWELDRIHFFPKRWVAPVVTTEGVQSAVPTHLSADVVDSKLFPVLRKLVDDKQVFVQEAALITMGRVAANEAQRQEARTTLLKKISHKNHLIARAAALGLHYVADETSIRPMFLVANDEKAPEDVRAFLALTLTTLKSPMAPELLKAWAGDKKGFFELRAAALMALGFSDLESDPAVPEFLADFYKSKERAELRALAVESFGRLGCFAVGHEILQKALTDKEVEARRSAAVALGALDYRTDAERQIEKILAPYRLVIGVPVKPEDDATVKALEAQIPAEREKLAKAIKDVVKDLGEAMERDTDAFVGRMACVSLGRLAAQAPSPLAIKLLEAKLKKDQVGDREFALLALAIARAPQAYDFAVEAIQGKNNPPTTRGAGCVALGILGEAKGDAILRKIVEDDVHPYIRGYAALAMGMVGAPGAAGVMQPMVRTTKSPVSRAYGALGMGLLGTAQGADDIVAILKTDQVRDGFVASHMVYALGLTKDRRATTFDALVTKAQDDADMYVQAATIAAIGYLATGEFYPQRHLMAKGFNYLMDLEYISTYFYKL